MNPELYALASNPAAAAETLRSLAFYNPELWDVILQNPACYLELRSWITQQPGYVASLDQQPGVYSPQQPAAYSPQQTAMHPSQQVASYAPSATAPVAAVASKGAGGIVFAVMGLGVAALASDLGGVRTALGGGVSREQGCQNLMDALTDVALSEPNMDGYLPDFDDYDLEDWDALAYASMGASATPCQT